MKRAVEPDALVPLWDSDDIHRAAAAAPASERERERERDIVMVCDLLASHIFCCTSIGDDRSSRYNLWRTPSKYY